MLKSPAMGEALKPIHHLEAEAAKDNELARQAYEAGLQMFKLKQNVAKALTKSKLKKDGEAKIEIDLSGAPQEPLPVRYRTNDTTYEGLGELLSPTHPGSSSNATSSSHCCSCSIAKTRRLRAASICRAGLGPSHIHSTGSGEGNVISRPCA
jgi:hypothetical protein